MTHKIKKILQDKDDRQYLMLFSSLLIFFIIVSFVFRQKRINLNMNPRYTICTTIKINDPYNTQAYVLYDFNFNEKSYSGSSLNIKDIKVPNGKYFVKFYKKNPNNNILLDNFILKDTIYNIPDNGWSRIPKDLIEMTLEKK